MGLELSNKAYQYVHNILGLPVLQNTLEEASFEDNEFDAVTLFGILEHVPNRVEILTEAVRIVKPGGIIAVSVPNAYSLATMTLREKTVTFDGCVESLGEGRGAAVPLPYMNDYRKLVVGL